MIESFGDQATKDVFLAKVSKVSRSLPLALHNAIRRKLAMIDAAAATMDLQSPPGNRLEKLSGDRVGQWSIRVNDRYRITFRFAEGNASDVTCEDYH